MTTLSYTDTLTVIDCSNCGIAFAVPESWRVDRRNDHKTFYCPNGCPRWFPTGTSDEEKARKEAERLKQRLASEQENVRAARADAEVERRRAAAHKGHVTRLRKRVGKGKCPCCSTEFPNIAQHMADEHPGYGEDE